ncbi:unnamed protein product, partial [Symbiodinium sp. KB8]
DWLELEPIAAEVWQNGGKLVTFRWFQEVTEGGLCAQDPQECTRHIKGRGDPIYVREWPSTSSDLYARAMALLMQHRMVLRLHIREQVGRDFHRRVTSEWAGVERDR